MEIKYFDGKIINHKQIDRNGVPIGIIEGYIATWDIDRDKDKFIKGAFEKSLQRHRELGRQIRMKAYHQRVIGGFPIETVKEDDIGLFGIGEINLDSSLGKEIYSLVKQGILTDMSIGYSVSDSEFMDNIRNIKTAEIWEGSIVEEPANTAARILSVKTVNSRAILPKSIADREYRWDAIAADNRVREWAGASDSPNNKYASAFLWYDSENKENFTAYKLQIADIVDGSIKIIPRAVFAVRAVLSGARGGVDIPADDKDKIKSIINNLYEEMEMESPFKGGTEAMPICVTEIKHLTRSMMEDVIQHCKISKNASNYIARYLCSADIECEEISAGVKELLALTKNIKSNLGVS